MKILKTLGIVLAVLVAIALIVPAFLASEKTIERTITVNAPVKSCYVLVNDLKSWNKWSPWYAMDTTVKMEFSENASGENAWYTWVSTNSNVGEGKLTITHSSMDSVVVKLEFKDWGESSSTYFFESLGENETKVGTRMVAKSDGYLSRWFVVMMSGMLADNFDKGLASIKEVAESQPLVEAPVSLVEEVEEAMMRNIIYLTQKDSIPSQQIGEALGKAYGTLMGAVHANGLQMTGAPFAIYRSYNPTGYTVMESAIPVNEYKSIDGINCVKVDSMLVLQVNYYGPYEGTTLAHDKMSAYVEANGYEVVDDPWEIYVTDPEEEKDPSKVLTQVVYPVRKK